MMKLNMKQYILTILVLLFYGCGGDSGTLIINYTDGTLDNNTTKTDENSTQISYIIDSPIKGLNYNCGTINGITDKDGKFTCKVTPIIFKIGALTIGTLDNFTNDLKVYPQDLLSKPRTDVEDLEVIELSRFLQTLDDDGNISQFINITQDTASNFKKNETYSELSSLSKIKILTDLGLSYIPREDVIQHLRNTLGLKNTSLTKALEDENASLVNEDTLYNALEQEANDKFNYCKSIQEFIYPNGLENVSFPNVRSDYFNSSSNNNIPLHIANNGGNYHVYSYIGEKPKIARYAILGTNIFKFDTEEGYSDITNELNQELKNSTTQLFKWLLKKHIDINIFDENLTIVVNSSYMKDSLNDWLHDNSLIASGWNITTDTTLLTTANFDLYMTENEITENYKTAIEQHKPVVIFQNWIHPNDKMLNYFDLQWSWYGGLSVGDWESIDELCKSITPEVSIYNTIKNLKENTLDFNINDTVCTDSFGTITCNDSLLLNTNGKTLAQEFTNGAKVLRDIIIKKDKEGVNIFKLSHQNDFLKLAILLGDKYRSNITYPMDKITTDDSKFFKAFYADYSISYVRSNNTFQPDLGDFSHNIDTLKTLKTTTEIITMIPTRYSEWSATGLYAIPGKQIKIKRLDDSNNTIEVRFNMLRVGTTKIWNENSYSRPYFTTSNPTTIEKEKEYILSSPIGGPIYIKSDAIEENATSFTIEFENIVKFPSLMNLDSDTISNFTNEITTSVFNWIDIKTPFIEIHTIKSKFDLSYTTQGYFPYNGDLTKYLEDINHYLVVNNLNLAGFKGEGLYLSSEVQDWCSAYNLDCTSDIHKKPAIQHINSDIHALCGSGCSGNPYDASWSIEPTGWGDSHEYGHNLQRARLKIYGGRSTEVSNNIFPLHTNWDYLVNHNLTSHPDLNVPDSLNAYTQLQTEIKKGTLANIEHPMWSEDGIYDNVFVRLSFYNQLPFIHGSWDIFTKLYILERLFTQAIKTNDSWENNKTALGFSSYTIEEANNINGNDFMAISLSNFTNKDHKDYFRVWGIEVSEKAKKQIDTNGFDTAVPLEYYWIQDNKLTKDFPTKTLPLDGVDEESINISGICTSTILSECKALNGTISFDTPNSSSIYFLSQWDENGDTTTINSGDEGYSILNTTAVDDENNKINIILRAAKTTTNDGVDGIKIHMNDTSEVDAEQTSLVIWIDSNDNNFEENKQYTITDPLYINVKENNSTIRRIKVNIEDLTIPTTLTYNDVNTTLIQGFPKIEDSSTYFVTTTSTQGPINGIWENNTSYTPLTIKIKDDNGNPFELKLRAQRDAYHIEGDSGTYTVMNSAIIYGKENAFLLIYNSDDNPNLSHNTHYISSELLIIDAKLWHYNNQLRAQMQIKIDITTP